jgi:tetratricopeptide (TPR) repeat protein
MKRFLLSFSIASLLVLTATANAVVAQRKPTGAKPAAQAGKAKTTDAARPKTASKPADEDALKAELDEVVKLDAAARVERLRAFVKENPDSPQTLRAQELLTSARAALGDEKLRGGDRAAGVELFRAAVTEAPATMSDKLFAEVVAQLPANLYVLGERDAGLELARAVEARAAGNAQRLLTVASFYLGIEQPEEAARVARDAIALQPDSAAAHQALGMANRYALRLEEAASEFARALELDPKSAGARRVLAELRRATGKPEDALALYREQLAAEPQDANARGGIVLALFDVGRREEAERELQSALTGEARDLPLLVGASYWYAAHGEGARSLELAEKAIAFESRFGWAWARIAEGRALLALKRPLEAERALRAARRFGNFPTLDYELAAALASAGLYDEAAEQLSRSFVVREGQIETRLAGRVNARASDFNELLAPERRASLSQFAGASTIEEAKTLKALLAFHQATGSGAIDERSAAEAAREFAAGEDEMRAFRNLYAASRLEQRGAAHGEVLARAEAAVGGVESALKVPHAPVALFADTDELRELRRQVVEQDAPLNMLDVQRDVLSKVLRGRIEELAGWALYNQGQTAEAAVRLRRAVSVLPESTMWWRTAEWRLGAALEASGSARDALDAYVTSYRSQPEPTRRSVIEALYKRLNNGSLEGLDEQLQTRATAARNPATSQPSAPEAAPAESPSSRPDAANVETTKTNTQPAATNTTTPPAVTNATMPPASEATPEPTPSPTLAATPSPTLAAAPSPTPTTTPSPTTEPTAVSTPTSPPAAATPSPSPESATTTATPESSAKTGTAKPEPVPTAKPEPASTEPASTARPEPSPSSTTPTPTPSSPTPEPSPEQPSHTEKPEPSSSPEPEQKPGLKPGVDGTCVLTASEATLTLKNNGGSATVAIGLENYTGRTPPRIDTSTANWADIIVLAEQHTPADGSGARFTITSVSTKTGTFNVLFSSPCGKQQITVNVN